jgi:cysteine dioxygenase
MSTAVKQISIGGFVAELRKFPEAAFEQTEQLRRFLQETPLNPDSLAPYLIWDRQHYTRNLIDKTPLYELMAICWEVGQASSVHNHRDQNCWMAVPHRPVAGGELSRRTIRTSPRQVHHPVHGNR